MADDEGKGKAEQREPRFTRQRLEADPAIIDQPHHVVVGAMEDAGAAPDDEFTRAQAKRVVEKFLNRDVQTDEEG